MTAIRLRARITIRTSGGYLTDADARRARHTARAMAPGIPVDLHIPGRITGLSPWALHPLGDLLADAEEVTIHTDTPTAALAAALTRAAESAIGAEHEFRSTHAVRAGGGQ
jgi:hypothetical protein